MKERIAARLVIKVLLPMILTMFFLYIMVNGTKEDNTKVYNFKTEEISNVTAVGIEEFTLSISTLSDSVFLFCSNEDKNCNQMLKDIHDINKDTGIEYINVLELVDSEKEDLKSYEMFKNDLYPKLIIIKNNNIKYYDSFLSKEELNRIL